MGTPSSGSLGEELPWRHRDASPASHVHNAVGCDQPIAGRCAPRRTRAAQASASQERASAAGGRAVPPCAEPGLTTVPCGLQPLSDHVECLWLALDPLIPTSESCGSSAITKGLARRACPGAHPGPCARPAGRPDGSAQGPAPPLPSGLFPQHPDRLLRSSQWVWGIHISGALFLTSRQMNTSEPRSPHVGSVNLKSRAEPAVLGRADMDSPAGSRSGPGLHGLGAEASGVCWGSWMVSPVDKQAVTARANDVKRGNWTLNRKITAVKSRD